MRCHFLSQATLRVSLWLLALSVSVVSARQSSFSEWSNPEEVNSVNSPFLDMAPAISRDGLSLYFASNRPGGYGLLDIWVAERASIADPFGEPRNLGPEVNSPFTENAPALSPDGHTLLFQSNRPDLNGFGAIDIYATRRHNKRDNLHWHMPVNLGPGVNGPFNENGPELYEDDKTGTIQLYFNSNRPGGLGGTDVYVSTLQPDDTFAPAIGVPELNSPKDEGRLSIRRDGLELLLTSSRAGTLGASDVWVSTRPTTSTPWSTPANLGATINGAVIDQQPALSFDGRLLYFSSNRNGTFDLFVTQRSKIRNDDDEDKARLPRPWLVDHRHSNERDSTAWR